MVIPNITISIKRTPKSKSLAFFMKIDSVAYFVSAIACFTFSAKVSSSISSGKIG